jgi:hypothetical protein
VWKDGIWPVLQYSLGLFVRSSGFPARARSAMSPPRVDVPLVGYPPGDSTERSHDVFALRGQSVKLKLQAKSTASIRAKRAALAESASVLAGGPVEEDHAEQQRSLCTTRAGADTTPPVGGGSARCRAWTAVWPAVLHRRL